MKKLILIIVAIGIALIVWLAPHPQVTIKGGYAYGAALTTNITAAGENYTAWNNEVEIRQFVKDSGFSERAYEYGVYDCVSYDGIQYFGFALDFVEYAKTKNRLFIPYAEYTKGGKMWHLKTITFIGNRVYSVDPMYYDGRVNLCGRVD